MTFSLAISIDVISIIYVLQSTEKIYKDIIVPLVGQVIDQLKSKRITDVKVYLVGISSKYPYPIIYDTDRKWHLNVTELSHRWVQAAFIDKIL